MGITTGVEHDAAVIKSHCLQAVHNLALDVALENIYRVLWKLLGQLLQILVERAVAIHLGFTPSHEVQVGTIDDVDDHRLLLEVVQE